MAANHHIIEFSKQAQKVIETEGHDFGAKVMHQLHLFTEHRHNHGLAFEKLHGQDGLCSIRLNRECRLILKKTENKLRLKKILLHHEYNRLKSLPSSGGFDDSDELTFIGNSFSQCSEMQKQFLNKQKYQTIEMILGLPGTGKSILLCRAIAEHINPEQRVLFLCPRHLVESTQRLFELQGVGRNVLVCDYASYMGVDASFEDTQDLLKWLDRSEITYGKKITPYSSHALAQEFELISAIEMDAYLDASSTQSCYPVQFRPFIMELFQNYMGEGNSRKNVRLSTLLPQPQFQTRFDIIAIDELQTLSRRQLRNLFNFFSSFENSKQTRIVIAGDENQNHSTASSPVPYLRTLIENSGMSLGEIRLKKGFRSPARVEMLANQLLSLRGQCFGEPHRSGESSFDARALAFEHCISYVTNKEEIPLPPDDYYEKLQYVVIADKDYMAEARAHFAEDTIIISYDEAHGVQFKNVILWRPFENNTFKDMNSKLRHLQQPIEKGIRAEEVSVHTQVHKVYTAILRTMQQLIIFDPNPLRRLCKALELSSGIVLSIDVGPPVSEHALHTRIEELIECGVLTGSSFKQISIEPMPSIDVADTHSSSTTPLMPIKVSTLETPAAPLEPAEQSMLEKFCLKLKDNFNTLASVLKFCVKKQNAEESLDYLFHHPNTNLFQFLLDNKPYIAKLIQILINDISLFLTEFHTKIDFSSEEWLTFQKFRACRSSEKWVKDTPLLHQVMKSGNWEKLLQTYYQLGGDINVSSPKDRNGLLHDETILPKLPKVMKILDFGGDCNVPNSDGFTAFHVVISQKFPIQQKLALIKEFLKHGLPRLDNTLDIGSSVLGYAISSNQLEIVKLLVEADETCKTFLDSYNLSCLSHAIFKNCHIDIICYFLKSDWEPNGFKYGDATHFSGAITSDRLDIVDALLRHRDIDPNFGGKFVPLTVALRHRHIQKLPMIKKLLSHPKTEVDRVTEGLSLFTPLGYIVRENESLELARVFLENRANPNLSGGSSKTFPLHDAIMNHHSDMVKLLLDYQACPNRLDPKGNNALHLAVQTRNPKIIQYVLNTEVDVNHVNNDCETPLFWAIKEQQRDIVYKICKTQKVNFDCLFGPNQYSYLSLIICEYPDLGIFELLLKYGANPNLLHRENVTPLYFAAQEMKESFVDLLLENGADPHIPDDDNVTPLMIASKDSKGVNVIKSLISHQVDVNAKRLSNSITPLMIAVYCDANEVVQLLLQSKANPNDVSSNGSCAVSIAISSQNIEIFELLMKYGIDINQSLHDGLTPLMYAIQNECITMVNKLLQYEGIDVNALSETGDSALSVACEAEDISMVKLLSEKGADSNLVVGKNNPLCMVASSGKLEIAEYLIQQGAKVNPSWQPSPITLAMVNKQDDMVKLLLEKAVAEGVSLTGPHSLWIPAIKSGHIPNLIQIENIFGACLDDMVVDDKTPLTLAIDFRCKDLFRWLLARGVEPTLEQITLMHVWDDLIFVDGIIHEAKKIYKKLLAVPNKKDLDKEIDFSEMLDALNILHSKYTLQSNLHGLTYFADLMRQLHFYVGKIQEFVDSQPDSEVTSQFSP